MTETPREVVPPIPHTLLIRTPTIRDWRCDGKCTCEGWEFFDAYDLPALERAFRDFHLRKVTPRG